VTSLLVWTELGHDARSSIHLVCIGFLQRSLELPVVAKSRSSMIGTGTV